jgi:hypothetical protein
MGAASDRAAGALIRTWVVNRFTFTRALDIQRNRSERPLTQKPPAAGGGAAGALPFATKHPAQQLGDVHTMFGGFGTPPLRQDDWGLMLLGLPGGLHHPLDQLRRPHPSLGLQPLDRIVDRIRPLRKGLEQLGGHAGQLPVAPPVRLRPRDPQRPGQPALVGAAVDRVRRQAVAVQVATIKRRPATIRPLHPVRHDHMGVQQRVAGS